MKCRARGRPSFPVAAIVLFVAVAVAGYAQGGRGGAPAAPANARAAAATDVTGYWVSLIVDEWRFRVTPQKGDILYLPINNEARRVANDWDPSKDEADGKSCKAYGAVGVMQRPGRLHITWENDDTLRIDADSGTQTRLLRFGPPPAQKGEPSWQGYSAAQWVPPGLTRGRGLGMPTANAQAGTGTLRVVTTNMLPGYIRKNGVPYSANAVLTESFNRVAGADGQAYLAVTTIVDDPAYLNQPFVRTYTFKKQDDASGWEPTPCWPR
jgi:hypothetical protein